MQYCTFRMIWKFASLMSADELRVTTVLRKNFSINIFFSHTVKNRYDNIKLAFVMVKYKFLQKWKVLLKGYTYCCTSEKLKGSRWTLQTKQTNIKHNTNLVYFYVLSFICPLRWMQSVNLETDFVCFDYVMKIISSK